MKFDSYKLDIALARACMNARELREKGIAPTAIHNAMQGHEIRPATAGRIATALGVDVADLMEERK